MENQEVTANQVQSEPGTDGPMMENAPAMFDEHGQSLEDIDNQERFYGQEEQVDEEETQEQHLEGIYQEEDEETHEQRAESGNQIGDADVSIDEDQELKMKIVLYYHTLVSGALVAYTVCSFKAFCLNGST